MNQYRYYTSDDMKDLKYIAVMKYAHFSLKEIQFFMELMKNPISAECKQKSENLFTIKVQKMKNIMAHYQKIIQIMEMIPVPEEELELKNRSLYKRKTDLFVADIFEEIVECEE